MSDYKGKTDKAIERLSRSARLSAVRYNFDNAARALSAASLLAANEMAAFSSRVRALDGWED